MSVDDQRVWCIFNADGVPQKDCWGLSEETAWEMFYRLRRSADENRIAFRQDRVQLGYRAVELSWAELKKAQGWR